MFSAAFFSTYSLLSTAYRCVSHVETVYAMSYFCVVYSNVLKDAICIGDMANSKLYFKLHLQICKGSFTARSTAQQKKAAT